MGAIPKKPTSTKGVTLDDIIGQQRDIRDQSTTTVPKKAKTDVRVKKPAVKKKRPATPKAEIVAPVIETAIRKPGRPSSGEVCRPAQFYLPQSLTDRISAVSDELCGGNMSLYARRALEKAVTESEVLLKKLKQGK